MNLLAAQLDLKLITRLETELGCVSLANHQVAVELHLGLEAEIPAPLAGSFAATSRAEVHSLGLEQGLVEGGEVEALAAVLLGADLAAAAHQIGF